MSVLVLDGQSRAAVESLQALGRAGVEVHVAAERADCASFHSRYARGKYLYSSYGPDQLLSWVRQVDLQCNFELVIPSTESSLVAFKNLHESDPLRLKAVLPSDCALEVALDKEKTRQLAIETGVRVPAATVIKHSSTALQPTAFPVVLKPRRSKVLIDGRLVTIAAQIVTSEEARLNWLARWLPYTEVQQQEYIAGDGIGIEFLYNQGHRLWHFAHQRVHELPLEGGASCYRKSIDAPAEALAAAESLLNRLHWHGVAMVEFKRDRAGNFWMLEINPRLWGSLALAIDCGVNFPLGLLMIARKQESPAQPAYKAGYYTRDVRSDIRWLRSNFVASNNNSLQRLRPRLRSLLECFRPLVRCESWDHFDRRDLGVTAWILRQTCLDQASILLRWKNGLTLLRQLRHHHNRVLSHLRTGRRPARLLFLCHGNICRSPLAQRLAQQYLPDIAVDSAGLFAAVGRGCPEHILKIAGEFSLDLSRHSSRRVTKSQIETADLILVMDQENYQHVAQMFPEALSRTTMLGLFSRKRIDIKDPYQANISEARVIAQQLATAVQGLTTWLNCCTPNYCASVKSSPQPET
jgi:protein-tyrosine-phosphatase/predicted ATP-grasp superfamily ATP-dependent carboligase